MHFLKLNNLTEKASLLACNYYIIHHTILNSVIPEQIKAELLNEVGYVH